MICIIPKTGACIYTHGRKVMKYSPWDEKKLVISGKKSLKFTGYAGLMTFFYC